MQIENTQDLPTDINEMNKLLNHIFDHCDDFKVRHLTIPSGQRIALYYFKGLVGEEQFHDSIIEPLIKRNEHHDQTPIKDLKDVLYSLKINRLKNWRQLIEDCLEGKVVCHVESLQPVTVFVQNRETRGLNEPTTEFQVYGPKIGFIENSTTNISILRNFIRDPRLKVKDMTVGSLSRTKVHVVYLEEYIDPDLRDQVVQRLRNVPVDNVVSSGDLMKYLIDYPMSLFPQVYKTERPDMASFALSQGKVIIIVDNSPFVLIVPTSLMSFYTTAEDNFMSVWNRSFLRVLRLSSMFLAVFFPALYVALVGVHPELLPTTLALTIAESRANIPFPAPAEAFLMMFALDVLIEASIRLPSFVGQTIGIVGGLVIGQAAVEAGIVSSTMIIVIGGDGHFIFYRTVVGTGIGVANRSIHSFICGFYLWFIWYRSRLLLNFNPFVSYSFFFQALFITGFSIEQKSIV